MVVEVSSASPASPDPVWVDISRSALTRGNGSPIEISTGRQDETQQAQPSRLSLSLDNRDNRFTPHNPTSPYYPWFEQGRRIRVRETMGPFTYDLFDGFIEMPQVVIRPPTDVHNWLTLTAVDRLGRLERARKFVSNLTEHVLYSGGTSLVGYWPLLDVAEPFANLSRTPAGQRPSIRHSLLASTLGNAEAHPATVPRGGQRIPGDDLVPVLLTPGVNGAVTAWHHSLGVTYPFGDVLYDAGQIVTVVVWVSLDLTWDESISILGLTVGDGLIDLLRRPVSSGGDLRLTKPVGTLTGSVNTNITVGSDRYYLIGLRYGFTPNVLELWVDDQTYVATLSGSLAGPDEFVTLTTSPNGSVAHLQLYIGASTDFTHDDFLAQREVGLLGFDRQRVDQRIRTILNYAGVTDAELELQESPTVMQPAAFAGQASVDLARAATVTDGGVLLTRAGEIVFQSRKHRYDI